MKKLLFFGLMVALSIIAVGCSIFVTDKEKEEVEVNKGTFFIEKDKAEELEVQLNMGVGELTVSKGSGNWIEGSIETNYKELEPIVTYANKNNKGVVVIEQQNNKDIRIGKIKNQWDMQLSEEILMELSVMTGAASSKLDLKGLQLSKLDVETGVGELHIDLAGDWKKGFNTNIKTGVGAATITLPSDVGVKIKYEKGIGAIQADGLILKEEGVYINEAYENTDAIIEIVVEIGVGEVSFELEQ